MKEESKRNIEEKISKFFPALKKYNNNKFYCVLEPLIVGIEIIKIPRSNDFRPHFVCYPLWYNTLKSCFSNPLMLIEIKDKRKDQISLTLDDMSRNFDVISNLINNQIPFKFGKDLKLKSLISVLDKYSKTSFLGASMNSYLQARLAKQRVIISLLTSNLNFAQKELKNIENKKWDLEHFSLWDINYNDWINEVKKVIEDPKILESQLGENLRNNKISNLNRFKIF